MSCYYIEHNGRKLNAFHSNNVATNPFSFSTRCWVVFDTVDEAREYTESIKRDLNTKEHPDYKKYLAMAEKFQIRNTQGHAPGPGGSSGHEIAEGPEGSGADEKKGG